MFEKGACPSFLLDEARCRGQCAGFLWNIAGFGLVAQGTGAEGKTMVREFDPKREPARDNQIGIDTTSGDLRVDPAI
jgi:hypothetical protein